MDAQKVAAVAACVAAGLSLVNVGYQAYLANRNESRKWRREKLPEMIRELVTSLDELIRKVVFKPFESGTSPVEHILELTREDYTRAARAIDTLAITGSPRLVQSAKAAFDAATDCLDYLGHHPRGAPNHSLEQEREVYWTFVEANHAFLCAARKEIGLGPIAPDHGLANWLRQKQQTDRDRAKA